MADFPSFHPVPGFSALIALISWKLPEGFSIDGSLKSMKSDHVDSYGASGQWSELKSQNIPKVNSSIEKSYHPIDDFPQNLNIFKPLNI
jgi:hypothetical protein